MEMVEISSREDKFRIREKINMMLEMFMFRYDV